MSDIADDADKRIFDAVTNAVEAASRAANKPKQYFTDCNWCGDPTEDGAQWCSPDCRNDAWRYHTTLKRNGIKHE